MKKLLTIAFLGLAMAFSTEAVAQNFSGLDKSPADIALYPQREPSKSVKIVYSRPQLNGRSVATLAPAGKVWRTGANESAEITFYQDVTFGGKAVKAGTYSLFAIPGASEWTVIINKELNEWGAFSYDEGQDVVRVSAKASTGDKSLEAFSIAYKGEGDSVDLVLGWGTTRVTLPIGL